MSAIIFCFVPQEPGGGFALFCANDLKLSGWSGLKMVVFTKKVCPSLPTVKIPPGRNPLQPHFASTVYSHRLNTGAGHNFSLCLI